MSAPGSESFGDIRRHTGAVGLIVNGQRPMPRSASQILEVASATEFTDEAGLVEEDDSGQIAYLPCVRLPSPGLAIAEGALLARLRARGNYRAGIAELGDGTFFLHVDFIEGPDFGEGRWIARVISETGDLSAIITGVEVKQLLDFHVDEEMRREHSRTALTSHALGSDEVARIIGLNPGPGPGGPGSTNWIEWHGDWEPFGTIGCQRTSYCVPKSRRTF